MEAMREGMEQYGKELIQDKEIIPPLNLDDINNSSYDLDVGMDRADKVSHL